MTSSAVPVRRIFKKGETVWLCLTTLRHRRFVEDVVHIIGLPEGARVRLRYRRRYVCAELWKRVADQILPREVHILIALAGTDDAGKNDVEPLRRGSLVAARCEGGVLVLDVSLEEFPQQALPIGTFWAEVKGLASNLPVSFGANAPSEGTYLQQLSDVPRTITAEMTIDVWERVSQAFFRLDDYAGHSKTSFLYFLHGLPARTLGRLRRNGSLILEAGSSIEMEVHTITRSSKSIIRNAFGEVRLELSHPNASFTSSRRVRVDSQRDVKAVGLATTALFRRSYGHLSARMIAFRYGENGKDKGDAEQDLQPANGRDEIVVARYDFPLRVGRWRPWAASVMVGLAAAAAVYEAPDSGEIGMADLFLPAVTFLLAFFGLVLGLRREGNA